MPELEPSPSHSDASRASFTKTSVLFAGLMLVFTISMSALLSWAESSYTLARAQVASAAPSVRIDPFKELSLEAKSAYVFDLTNDTELFSLNADVQLPLASITKIPLVLVVSEVLKQTNDAIISRGAVERGDGGGLGTGDTWRVSDLINFTLLVSSNAGAEALAEAAEAGLRAKYPEASSEAAVWRMNELSKELGLTHTYFLNPSGLDISPTQASAFGTARDVAHIIAYAAKTAPALFAVTAEKEAVVGPQNGTWDVVHNTNEVLSDIPGLIVGKTGFTDLAGGNLAIVFELGPRRIAAVVLGSSSDGRFEDMKKLFETARDSFERPL